jgi:hypothetical protein
MTIKDFQRDLLASGIDIDASAVWCMLLEFGWWASKYRSWTADGWKKVAFSDEFVQGYRASVVRGSTDEPLRAEHLQQTIKYLQKKCFGVFSL